MPPLVRDLFLEQDGQPRGIAEQGWIGLVLPDFEREFDRADTGRIGAMRVAIGPALVLTGRHHPLHTPDIIRHPRIMEQGARPHRRARPDPDRDRRHDRGAPRRPWRTNCSAIEDQLLADDQAPDTRALITMRRLSARLHRMLGGLRIALARLDGDPALPPGFSRR